MLAAADGQDFGHHRPGYLLGAFRADVQSRRSVHLGQVPGCETTARLLQIGHQSLQSGAGSERPDVGHVRVRQRPQVVEITQIVVAHDHREGAPVEFDLGPKSGGKRHNQMGGGETPGVQKRRAFVGHHHLESQLGRIVSERIGVVARPTDQKTRRRAQNLHHQPTPPQVDHRRLPGGDRSPGPGSRLRFRDPVRQRTPPGPVRWHIEPGESGSEQFVHHRQGGSPGPERRHLLRPSACFFGGDHQQFGRSVASDSPPPDRLVIGGEIELHQAWPPRGNHLFRHLAQILVQTPPRHGPHRIAVLGHQLPGAQLPVGGTPHSHHRGEGEPLFGSHPVQGGLQDGLEIRHVRPRIERISSAHDAPSLRRAPSPRVRKPLSGGWVRRTGPRRWGPFPVRFAPRRFDRIPCPSPGSASRLSRSSSCRRS